LSQQLTSDVPKNWLGYSLACGSVGAFMGWVIGGEEIVFLGLPAYVVGFLLGSLIGKVLASEL
jgi:hypothetical protein